MIGVQIREHLRGRKWDCFSFLIVRFRIVLESHYFSMRLYFIPLCLTLLSNNKVTSGLSTPIIQVSLDTRTSAALLSLTNSARPGVTITRPTTLPGTAQKKDPFSSIDSSTSTTSKIAPKYQVLLFNDPVNTKEYVSRALMTLAGLDESKAYECMMQAHKHGMGLVGIWAQEEAEIITKQLESAGLMVTMSPHE